MHDNFYQDLDDQIKEDFFSAMVLLDTKKIQLKIEIYKKNNDYKSFLNSLEDRSILYFFQLLNEKYFSLEEKYFCFSAFYENKKLFINRYYKAKKQNQE
ncbi:MULTISPECIES: hypothetical protein [Enterobacteriaceae]|jgi:hypothetical protein|uniref:hypothetical protein n=1 Tax=Enterobacteriaceae TaxID=543 RepID=UPI002E175BBE|nr:hypothetical protein [Pseudocitrobacter sp. MW920760]